MGSAAGLTARHGRTGASLAGAAVLIAILTIAARLVGFGRIFVVSWALGVTSLGNIYQTINTLPNIVYETVAGGALAAVVVPLLASAISRGSTAEVNQTCSALLSWSVAGLAPLSVLLALFAEPIVSALLGSNASGTEVALGTRMLEVFAPQLVLYGVGIVFAGILQAHHRFAWPALAPLLSSVTVITAYVLFAAAAGAGAKVEGLPRSAELLLSVGTTAGVAVLSLCLLIPLRKLGIRVNPTLRFPPGVARRAVSLLGGGIAAVAAQQLTLLVVLKLAQQPVGATVTYGLAQTVFFVPWAVLAVPVATSAFPRLSAAYGNGDTALFSRTLAASTQAVVLLCGWAAGALVACSAGVGVVISSVAHGRDSAAEITGGLIGFAPGLIGFSLLALLARALYAAETSAATAVITVSGWAAVIFADIVLVQMVPVADRVPALGTGHSIGMTLLGIGLLLLCRSRLGPRALQGVGRSLLVGVLGGGAAAFAGYVIAQLIDASSLFTGMLQLALGGGVATVVFGVLLAVLDRSRASLLWGLLSSRLRVGAATSETQGDADD
ncbi:MAG: virulence factor MviN [Acidimicrobiales bacterium]|nr:MAG: virulence factor MviN [Acidimicrobiales bacterium]